jgi:threonine dehydratase
MMHDASHATTTETEKASYSGQDSEKPFCDSKLKDALCKMAPVKFEDIARAARHIRGAVRSTPCFKSYPLSALCGAEVFVKQEQSHFTGSFKERGARYALSQIAKKKADDKDFKGVIAASAGNHALALSWHGPQLKLPITVIMPTVAPLAKVGRCRQLGANVVVHGAHILEAYQHSQTAEFAGWEYLNGFDHPDIIAGAGTLGLEIDEQVEDIDFCIVPVGGAGLIAGVALALNTVRPSCTVLGVEPERCASFQAAMLAGEPVDTPTRPTLADGLAVPKVGANAFECAKDLVKDTVSVTERQIAIAMLRLIETEKMVIEGGGAVGLAAILPGGPLHERVQGKRVVLPLCGGNIDTTVLGRVLERGLAADGRIVKFVATISDRPGGIANISTTIAENGASIRDIYHERAWTHTAIDLVRIKCVIETTSEEHANSVRIALTNSLGVHALQWNAAD